MLPAKYEPTSMTITSKIKINVSSILRMKRNSQLIRNGWNLSFTLSVERFFRCILWISSAATFKTFSDHEFNCVNERFVVLRLSYKKKSREFWWKKIAICCCSRGRVTCLVRVARGDDWKLTIWGRRRRISDVYWMVNHTWFDEFGTVDSCLIIVWFTIVAF